MGRHRTSYKNSLVYAKQLIENGENIDVACRLSAHRYDENAKQIYRRLRKEERQKNRVKIFFYDGPIYLVNINNKKDIKKQKIAMKLNTKLETEKVKLYIENFYSKNNYKAIIKASDWEMFSVILNSDKDYENYLKNKKNENQ